MNIQAADLFLKSRKRKRFLFACVFCSLLAQSLLAADTGALKIEEAQRAFQERHKMIYGEAVSWTDNALGQSAPEYPPDGFYETDLSNSVQAASLVADLATKLDESRLLWNFTSAEGGDIEGAAGSYRDTVPLLGDKLVMPPPDEIGPNNYPAAFQRLTKGLCGAKYVVVMAEQVGSSGKGTPVEERSGGSFNEFGCQVFESSNWPGTDVPDDLQDTGTFTFVFQQEPVPGHCSVHVHGCYDSPVAWSTGHWTVGGVEATVVSDPVEWTYWYDCPDQDPPWCSWSFWEISPCGVPNEFPPDTEFTDYTVNGKTIEIPWELDVTECSDASYWSYHLQLEGTQGFTCEEHLQRAQTFWDANAWEDDPSGGIGANVTTHSGHWLRSWRGRIYSNLTNYNGTARCYLSLEGGEFEIGIAEAGVQPNSLQPGDTPVPTDLTWHFFQPVPTGTEWTSDVLGDNKPNVTACTEQWDWYIIHQVVIVTPDFQYNIEGCEPCSGCGDQCTPGSTSTFLTSDGALSMKVSLGIDSFGESAGDLEVYALRPDASLSARSALKYHTSAASELLRGNGGTFRQGRNSQALADVVSTSNIRYEIRFYTAANAGTKDDSGFYVPVGSAYKTITVENPDSSGATFDQLRVTEAGDGIDRVSDFVWSDMQQKWTLATGNGLRQESCTSVWDRWHTNRTDVYTITDGAGQTVSYKERKAVSMFGWGEEVVERVVDPDGAALTTELSYYDNSRRDGNNYSHLKQMVQPSGYWERYQYDSLGRTIKVVSQYLDADTHASDHECRVTTTVYSADDPAVTVIETIQGTEVSRRYTVYRPGETREIQVLTPNAGWDDPANLVTITRTYLGGPFEGKVQSVARPDGTMTAYEYEYVSSGTGSNLITTVSTGEPNAEGAAIVNGTKTLTTVNQVGTTIREEIHDITDENDTLFAWNQAVAFDDFGRATQVDCSDGTSVTTVYGCCGILSTDDREGIATAYTYDALKRAVTTTRAGITTSNSYDAAGHVLGAARIGPDGSAATLNTATYDAAGRLTSSTDGLTYRTSHDEKIDDDGHTVKTTTYPDNTTRIETYYQDGQLKSVTGTAVHGLRYEYGVEQNDGMDRAYANEIKLDADGNDAFEWTKTYTDMLGRPYKTVFADGSYSQSFFNNTGQLYKQRDPDGVVTLFAYNNKGELVTTALDMDRNDVIDYNGTDRITRSQNSVVSSQNTTVRRTTTSVWTTDNQNVAITTAVNDVSADGLQSWTITFGLTNSVATVYDRPNARRTITTTNPDGSYAVSLYENGRLQSQTIRDSQSAILQSTTYQYDPLGRLSQVAQASLPVAVTTAYAYDAADRLIAVTNAVGTANQQVTRYQYDSVGRQTQLTLPDNGTVTTEYFDTGELKKTYGVRTYPVEYSYDYAGRMKTMTTWKNFAGNTGTATTTWNYDPQRGFLLSKTYPSPQWGESQGEGPSYTYTPAGRLVGRTWARGVTTTYGYNNAAELTSASYDDGVTPSVASVYDRRGHRTSVTYGTNTCIYAYNDAGQLLTESFPNSGIIVTNTYDSLLRRERLESGIGVPPVQYSYDNASRLQSVSDGTHSATYAYLPNSSLVSNIVFKAGDATKMTTTKSYDNLNRLQKITSVAQASLPVTSSFAYTYNSANQRTRVELGDGSYWRYQYDPLGQVTSGKKYWPDGTIVAGQQFGYAFDDIGNRQSAVHNSQSEIYAANSLNQYTQRTVPGFLDVFGTAARNAKVTVNNQATTRKGEYFYKQLTVANSSSAVYTNVWIVGVGKNAGTNQQDIVATVTGNEYLPQSPEPFGYDADGNLTSDGRWAYTWDAENRLISMETDTNKVGAASVPRQKLLFGYDSQSRRISKVVSNWTSGSWLLTSDLRFIYDGWNLIAELNAESGELKVSYTWGLDLSGTMQGSPASGVDAGGVGGLLAVTSHQSPVTTHFVSYDGNGNVTALLDAQSATLSAQYDYGPFGETIRATGPAASLNPCRFSTKYTDAETAVVYYGYRYYRPSVGRWLSHDPMGEWSTPSLYGFEGDDPIDFVDVLGLSLYAFDGTGNDKDRDAARGEKTNVAILWQLYHRQGVKEKFYKPGVGTRDGLWNGFGSAFGLGFARRVEDMFSFFERQKGLGDCEVDILGFSRGAAEAREFANRVNSKYPDLKIRWLGLFDTVESVGGPGTDTAGYQMTIPSTVERAFQLVAGDEHRREFPLTSIRQGTNVTLDPRYAELYLYGAHSDIGGGYPDRRGLANRALQLMWSDGVRHGVPFDPIPSQYRDYSNTSLHDSREGWFYGDKGLDWMTGRWDWLRGPRQRGIRYAPLPPPPDPLLGVGTDLVYY